MGLDLVEGVPVEVQADVTSFMAILRRRLAREQTRIMDFFHRMDADRDGELNLKEFSALVDSLKIDMSTEALLELFSFIASNGSGITVRDLQHRVWERGAAPTEVASLAIRRGIELPKTEQQQHAVQSSYCETSAFSEAPATSDEEQPTPFYMQGSAKFDRPHIVERRLRLLSSGAIATACRQFWDTLKLPPNGRVSHDQYEMVHRLITHALAPSLGEAEWREACEDDWRNDLARSRALQARRRESKSLKNVLQPDGRASAARTAPAGGEGLDFDSYVMSFFEMADMWTDCVDEAAYVLFINELWQRVTHSSSSEEGTEALDEATRRSFRSLEHIVPFETDELKNMHRRSDKLTTPERPIALRTAASFMRRRRAGEGSPETAKAAPPAAEKVSPTIAEEQEERAVKAVGKLSSPIDTSMITARTRGTGRPSYKPRLTFPLTNTSVPVHVFPIALPPKRGEVQPLQPYEMRPVTAPSSAPTHTTWKPLTITVKPRLQRSFGDSRTSFSQNDSFFSDDLPPISSASWNSRSSTSPKPFQLCAVRSSSASFQAETSQSAPRGGFVSQPLGAGYTRAKSATNDFTEIMRRPRVYMSATA